MPATICQVCLTPVPQGQSRCPVHLKPRRTASGRPWRRMREFILSRDNFTCRYCGGDANTVDHLTPVDRGGTDLESNLVAACGTCNSAKGTMTAAEYLAKRRGEHGR